MSWEVWTMKSKMSFFDPTLLKKNVGRFAPAWAILLVFWVLTGPLALLRELDLHPRDGRRMEALLHFERQAGYGVILAFFAALIFAALVFKYLHRTRSAYMMHAFPMTRSCLFITNAVSGLLFWLVPALLNVLLYLAVLGAMGVTGCGGALWGMLGKWILQYLFFYGLAVFTMHIAGSTVIAVLSYGALNFICLLLPLLVLLLISAYFRGFDYSVPESILRLSPVVALLTDEQAAPTLRWVYAAVGLGLLALAWLHYRFRQTERAGDPMAFAWARIAFRVVFTLCCALGLGWVLAAFFGLLGSDGETPVFLPYCLLGCVWGWFGSSMMVERTVKVFKKKSVWLGFAAFAGVLCLFVLGLKFDLLGFQRRVPETARVESVELWTNGDYDGRGTDLISLTETEDVEAVRAFHRQAIQSGWSEQAGLRQLFSDSYYNHNIHILYHLSDGSTLRRVYNADYPASQGERDAVQALAALYRDPEIAAAWYEKTLPERFTRLTLSGVTDRVYNEENDMYENGWEERACKKPAALKAAVLADAAAGRLPIVNFLLLYSPMHGDYDYSGWSELNLCYEYRANWTDDGGYTDYWYLQIPIVKTATETLKLFEP